MRGLEVQISDRQSVVEVPESLIRLAALRTLESEGIMQAEMSVAILDDAQIRAINLQYLGHDRPTDCLSFRLDDEDQCDDVTAKQAQQSTGRNLIGEVLISGETAMRAAETANWPVDHEVALYVIHGTLHLTGHDDCCPEFRKVMRTRERELLATLGIEMPSEALVDAIGDPHPTDRSAAS